ncbi:class I SAM-dependent methyltransferase [Streptomyces bathyalis]|uniref:Class I SAM-dependent methyltransferase n=1 Tax=Streptomyces bathyalis TaxID=2710756 RepID=A0A7T1T9V0_9ACTN|nr:class I SAM-dependent methyltransferase [Streptomyces bathyalis]QPP09004.1 class I SAM-dependent methyltransferase [Streptomyces bathyalis]
MDRQVISSLAHRDHPIAAPLHDTSVDRLLVRALPRGDERMLDLGCGEAAWLVRALRARPQARGEGVDVSPTALARAHETAGAAGLDGRLTLHEQDAARFTSPHAFDLVSVVGSTHAFGGLMPALAAAGELLAEGGRVLIGEGFWEREPSPAALAGLDASPGDFDDLATTVDRVTAAGWTPVHAHVSTPGEWDDYEWAWTGSLSAWALDHPGHPDSAHALEAAAEHREGWLRGYRGTLGFVTLLLRPSPPPRQK